MKDIISVPQSVESYRDRFFADLDLAERLAIEARDRMYELCNELYREQGGGGKERDIIREPRKIAQKKL